MKFDLAPFRRKYAKCVCEINIENIWTYVKNQWEGVRIFHNELHNTYSSPNFVRVDISRMIRLMITTCSLHEGDKIYKHNNDRSM
jgi:hypothetical protein